MSAEILEVYTINTAGRRKRTFGPGESIAWQMDVRFTDIAPRTSIHYDFIAKRVGDYRAFIDDWDSRGRSDLVWTPTATGGFDLDVSSGTWWMSLAWRLPETAPPLPGRWDRVRGRIALPFAEASDPGTWELQGRVRFQEADLSEAWDFTPTPFIYEIDY